uniref:Uncharacterized protein n=1 Tax=Knipowitschia caucasica TaxID=637954 RepID=A0AAV2M730_KNICA
MPAAEDSHAHADMSDLAHVCAEDRRDQNGKGALKLFMMQLKSGEKERKRLKLPLDAALTRRRQEAGSEMCRGD